jgi:hypothetical protein
MHGPRYNGVGDRSALGERTMLETPLAIVAVLWWVYR